MLIFSPGRTLGVIALIAAPACSPNIDSTCTGLFVKYTLTVLDGSKAPVEGADVPVTLIRTGQLLTSDQGTLPPGVYPLLDDKSKDILRPEGDDVRATVTKGASTVLADYHFVVAGDCHIRRITGPDTVTLN
jgi:hypothetical protein